MVDKNTFNSAQNNMSYDDVLVGKLHTNEIPSFLRIYQWKQTSITQSINRKISSDFESIDKSFRITGGGLVFHCPNDIVFSMGNPISDKILPKKLKKRCEWLADTLALCLQECNVPAKVVGDIKVDHQNINFCSSYHNPYEVMIGNDKVIGIALKKTKDWIVFQGVIHMSKTSSFFKYLPDKYTQYFTNGITSNSDINSLKLTQKIIDEFKRQKLI